MYMIGKMHSRPILRNKSHLFRGLYEIMTYDLSKRTSLLEQAISTVVTLSGRILKILFLDHVLWYMVYNCFRGGNNELPN